MEHYIKLWQSQSFRGTKFWFFEHINKMMRNIPTHVSKNDLKLMNFKNMKTFDRYMINYVNKFTEFIYAPNNQIKNNIVMFRGESRKHFDYKIGDIIHHNYFTSVSEEISYAYTFTTRQDYDGILFVICMPIGTHVIRFPSDMEFHCYGGKCLLHEFEWLLPPCTYFQIVSIKSYKLFPLKILRIVKLNIIYQDHYIFDTNIKYVKKHFENVKSCNFRSKQLDTFISLYHIFQETKQLTKYVRNSVSSSNYFFIYANSKIMFDKDKLLYLLHDMDKLNSTKNIINEIRKLEKKHHIQFEFNLSKKKKITSDFYDKILKSFNMHKKQIHKLYKLKLLPISTHLIDKKIYCGFSNMDNKILDKILGHSKLNMYIECSFDKGEFMQNSIHNNYYPNVSIIKANKKKVLYNKYLLEIHIRTSNINMIKILYPQNNHESLILVSLSNGYTVRSTKKTINKFGLPMKIYKIDLQ